MFVEHGVAEAGGDRVDELVAAQNASDIAIVENVLGSRQSQ